MVLVPRTKLRVKKIGLSIKQIDPDFVKNKDFVNKGTKPESPKSEEDNITNL